MMMQTIAMEKSKIDNWNVSWSPDLNQWLLCIKLSCTTMFSDTNMLSGTIMLSDTIMLSGTIMFSDTIIYYGTTYDYYVLSTLV